MHNNLDSSINKNRYITFQGDDYLQTQHGGVILAGGKGQRLLPLTSKIPKPLLAVNGKTPFERCLTLLKNAEIRSVAVTTGYLGDKIEKFIFDGIEELNITYYRELSPKGTAGSVIEILPKMEDDFFVLSGDIVFDIDLKKMMSFHKENNAAVTIACVKSHFPTEYGTVISENFAVTSFREKPSWKQVISTKINAGIYIINRKILNKYKEGVEDFASDLFPALLSFGEKICTFDSMGYWCDIGTPESYLSCNMHFSENENVMGDYISISQNSFVKNSVIMNGVRIGSGTKIISSVIGEGSSIGKNCIIENAVIGPDSLLCDSVIVEENGIVSEDSIIGKGKAVKGIKKLKELFSDSGKVFIDEEETEKLDFFAKAITHVSKSNDSNIYFFDDGTEKAKHLSEKLFRLALSLGAKAFSETFCCAPISSFAAAEENCFSVFAHNKQFGISFTVFDKNGLPLSREDQIKGEKHPPLSVETTKKHANEINFKEKYKNKLFSFISQYINEYRQNKKETENGFSILSQNIPCIILSEILKKAEIKVSFEEKQKMDAFYISDSGEDIYCITKTGQKLDKMHLLQICYNIIPQDNILIPELCPNALKNAITSSGGAFKPYGDSKKGREKDGGLYRFSDGISIAIASVCCCIKKNVSLSEISNELESFAFTEKSLSYFGNKGEAFEKLVSALCKNSKTGIFFTREKGSVSIFPQYENEFKIFAEAVSSEAAEELILDAEKDFKNITRKDKT